MEQYLKKQKIVCIILVCILLGVLGGIYAVVTSMNHMRADITTSKITVATLAASEHVQDANTARVHAIQNDVETISQKIITKDTVPAFLSTLEDMAKAHAVTITVSGVESTTKDTIPMLHISFSIEGSKNGVQSFFADIQKQTQAAVFTGLNISFDAPVVTLGTKKTPATIQLHVKGAGILELVSIVQ